MLDYARPWMSLHTPIRVRWEFAGLWVAIAVLPFAVMPRERVIAQMMLLVGGGIYCLLRVGSAEDLPRWARVILTPLSLLLLWSLRSTTGYDGLPIVGAFQLADQVGWFWAEQCYNQITWLVTLACTLVAIAVTWGAARLSQRTGR